METIRKIPPYVWSIIWLVVVLGVALSNATGGIDWLEVGAQMAICGVLPIVAMVGVRWAAQQISPENRAARVSEAGMERYMKFILGVVLLLGCGAIGLLIASPLLNPPSVEAGCTFEEGGTDCGRLLISNTSLSDVELELTGTFTFNGGSPEGTWQINGASDFTVSIRPGTYRAVVRCGPASDELQDVTVPAGSTSSIQVFGNC
jgi:hypothetical protein